MTLAPGSGLALHPPHGRLHARLAVLERRLTPPPSEPIVLGHPLPDLTGASAEDIAVGLVEAITAAHGRDPLWGTEADETAGHGLCPLCLASLDEAVELAKGGADPAPWPDPLFLVFEDELAWRDEMKGWTDRPEVTFDREAWLAEQEWMRAERVYADRYRGEIPPWVRLQPLPAE